MKKCDNKSSVGNKIIFIEDFLSIIRNDLELRKKYQRILKLYSRLNKKNKEKFCVLIYDEFNKTGKIDIFTAKNVLSKNLAYQEINEYNLDMYEDEIKKANIELRSCWNCNHAHNHLKESNSIIYCVICNNYYFKGLVVNKYIDKINNAKVEKLKKRTRKRSEKNDAK